MVPKRKVEIKLSGIAGTGRRIATDLASMEATAMGLVNIREMNIGTDVWITIDWIEETDTAMATRKTTASNSREEGA